MTQNKYLMKHFKEKGSISGIEASALYRIRSLSRRICDLRNKGWDFVPMWKKDMTGQRYVRYVVMSYPA